MKEMRCGQSSRMRSSILRCGTIIQKASEKFTDLDAKAGYLTRCIWSQESPQRDCKCRGVCAIGCPFEWFFACTNTDMMNPEERERMNELCAKIQAERDRDKSIDLLYQLNQLLGRKEQRLKELDNKKVRDRSGAS